MPDGMNVAAAERPAKLSTAAEMTALWQQYQEAKAAFEAAIRIQDDGTPETMAAFEQAQRAVMDAHTADLAGVVIKLKVLQDTVSQNDVIAEMISDLEGARCVAAEPLLPLWRRVRETYLHYDRIATLDDQLRETSRHLHPAPPEDIVIDIGGGMRAPSIEEDLHRAAQEAKEAFGAKSKEYKEACRRVRLRQEWEEACRAVDETKGTLKYDKDCEDAKAAFWSATEDFNKQKPTTTLGVFLQHLMSDDGDEFADNHPKIVEAIIQHLQSPLVRVRGVQALRQ